MNAHFVVSISRITSHLFAGARGRLIVDASARVWNSVLSFLLLPVYLALLGPESFGVVSVYVSIQTIIALFDCSMAPSLTREIARTQGSNGDWAYARNMARSMEIFYWILAGLAGLVLISITPIISSKWLNPDVLSHDDIKNALYLGAIGLAIQWPMTLYAGGMIGLQKQIPLAMFNVIAGTSRTIITLLCLWLVSPTLEMMFGIGVILTTIQTLLMRAFFWRTIPPSAEKTKASYQILLTIWKFAAGVSIITITSTLLLQADKIVLSKLLRLEDFGHYTISISIANGLFIITGALFSISFPKLSELVAAQDKENLIRVFRNFLQFVIICVLPLAAGIFFFSHDLLTLWTRSDVVATAGSHLLSIYIIGNMFNCLLSVPYTLMLGYGVTRTVVIANLILLGVSLPLQFLLFKYVGAQAGPIVWTCVNIALFSTVVYVIVKKLSPTPAFGWMMKDIFLSMLACFVISFAVYTIFADGEGLYTLIMRVFLAWGLSGLAVLFILKDLRNMLVHFVKGFFTKHIPVVD